MNSVISGVGFGIVTASIIALGAVGFTIQIGLTNVFNLAYADVMTASAFIAYLVNVKGGLNVWVSMAVAGLAGALLSAGIYFGIYRPFLRRGAGPFAVVMVSLSLGIILSSVLQAVFGSGLFDLNLAPESAIHLGDILWTPREITIMAIAGACILLLHLTLRYTRTGKAMRATAGDPALARTCGIDTAKVITAAWLVTGALCGLAGVALVMTTPVFDVTTGADFLLLIAAAAVLGGFGSPYGALVGALVIGIATELFALVAPDLKEVAAFLLLVVMLAVRPGGLLPGSAPAMEM